MLTKYRQQQAIVDLIHGLEPEINQAQLSKPYHTIWQEVKDYLDQGYDPYEIHQELYRFKLSDNGGQLADIIDAILISEAGYRQTYPSLQEIGAELPPTRWFWQAWIPRGLLTLLAAWPGVGKTYLALDLAHRVMANLPAPDGAPFELET